MGFIDLDAAHAVGLIGLGLIGGILGGFVGGGGAFVMVPGVMSLGGEGLVSVGTNLLHRLGRMATSPRRRDALRMVDRRLLVLLAVPSLVGIELGRVAITALRGSFGRGAADLYVSVVLIAVLTLVTRMLVLDLLRSRRPAVTPPLSMKGVMQRLRPLQIPPVIRFPESKVAVSLWLVLGIGFVAGWLGGTVALGGFLTVPALIYLLGVPAAAAIATDMSLVLIIGLYGTITYAARGLVDLQAALLLYLGSIAGLQLGMLGTKLVREEPIRIATCVVLGGVALSRLIALPLCWSGLGATARTVLEAASLATLYAGGALVVALVVGTVASAARGRTIPLAIEGEEDD